MLTKRIEPRLATVASYARNVTRQTTKTATRTAKGHPVAVVLGVLLLVVAVAAAIVILKAVVRRRRRTLLQRALGCLEDLGKHRDRIAGQLKDLLEENLDTGAVAREVSKRIEAIQHELRAVDQAIAAFGKQRERLDKQIRK